MQNQSKILTKLIHAAPRDQGRPNRILLYNSGCDKPCDYIHRPFQWSRDTLGIPVGMLEAPLANSNNSTTAINQELTLEIQYCVAYTSNHNAQ